MWVYISLYEVLRLCLLVNRNTNEREKKLHRDFSMCYFLLKEINLYKAIFFQNSTFSRTHGTTLISFRLHRKLPVLLWMWTLLMRLHLTWNENMITILFSFFCCFPSCSSHCVRYIKQTIGNQTSVDGERDHKYFKSCERGSGPKPFQRKTKIKQKRTITCHHQKTLARILIQRFDWKFK